MDYELDSKHFDSRQINGKYSWLHQLHKKNIWIDAANQWFSIPMLFTQQIVLK